MFKKNLIIITAFLTAAILFTNNAVASTNITLEKQTKSINKVNKAENILSTVDKYQEKYFTIVKRNDVLLQFEDDKNLNKDRKELNKLFNEVKKKVTNKQYLKQYKEIEKRYSKCNEETTVGINEFMDKYYNEIDGLLNTVYKEVKATIPNDDFKKLVSSEKKWLKEVKDYEKVFDSMGFGTIGTLIYYEHEISMRKFRTLLLMLYL